LAVSDLLGSKESIRNLEAGQTKEVSQQGDSCYEDNPELKNFGNKHDLPVKTRIEE